MFLTAKHKTPGLLALLLLVVLLGSMLVKPMHVLLVNHDVTQTFNGHSDSGVISNPHHDCSICNFEFCSFIPQNYTAVSDVDVLFAEDIIAETTSRLSDQISHHFQLRAPPVV